MGCNGASGIDTGGTGCANFGMVMLFGSRIDPSHLNDGQLFASGGFMSAVTRARLGICTGTGTRSLVVWYRGAGALTASNRTPASFSSTAFDPRSFVIVAGFERCGGADIDGFTVASLGIVTLERAGIGLVTRGCLGGRTMDWIRANDGTPIRGRFTLIRCARLAVGVGTVEGAEGTGLAFRKFANFPWVINLRRTAAEAAKAWLWTCGATLGAAGANGSGVRARRSS